MGSNPMNAKIRLLTAAVVLLGVAALQAQSSSDRNSDDPDARPPVTKADIRIVQRAKQILDSPAKWNR
jgi:hypothetical protein